MVTLGVLSTADLLLPLLADGEHPPMPVALVGSVIDLASLALIISALWRALRLTSSRGGLNSTGFAAAAAAVLPLPDDNWDVAVTSSSTSLGPLKAAEQPSIPV